MDLRRLQALVAIVDHGGFAAAADALHTVQSNISAHVARLEHELDAVLIDRAAGALTEEGLVVVERARRVQAELEGLVSDVAALRHEVRGDTRLGMIGTTARWLVPQLLASLEERHPAVRLVVLDATSTSLEPQLAAGGLDLAVVNLPVPDPDLTSEALFDEDLVLVVPADHPLATRTSIPLRTLGTLALLLPPPGTALRAEIDAPCRAAGIELRARAELDGVRLIASLATEGRGPTILPATALPTGPPGPWRRLSVKGLPRRRVGIAMRRRGLPAAPTRAVLVLLREIVARATAPLYPAA